MRTVIFNVEIWLSTFYYKEDNTATALKTDSMCSVTRDSFCYWGDIPSTCLFFEEVTNTRKCYIMKLSNSRVIIWGRLGVLFFVSMKYNPDYLPLNKVFLMSPFAIGWHERHFENSYNRPYQFFLIKSATTKTAAHTCTNTHKCIYIYIILNSGKFSWVLTFNIICILVYLKVSGLLNKFWLTT